MSGDAEPHCPDCTYMLTGLSEPRCPECGLRFDARLLTDPSLARPRPAWERRPRVSFLGAVWQMVICITFRPEWFFSGIQQPDRLRRSVYWLVWTVLATYLVFVAYIFAEHRISGFALGLGGVPWWQHLGLVSLQAALVFFWGVALALGPLVVMLLVADLLLWRDRARYRLFFKGAMYSATVYLWLAVAILIVRIAIAIKSPYQYGPPALGGWLLVGAMTWQYAMIYHAVLGKRFAALLPARPGRKAALSLWVLGVWLFAVYLALFDCYCGLRFATAAWCSPGLR